MKERVAANDRVGPSTHFESGDRLVLDALPLANGQRLGVDFDPKLIVRPSHSEH